MSVPAGASLAHEVSEEHAAFAYLIEGAASFDPGRESAVAAGQLAVLGAGDMVTVAAQQEGGRFLLVSGRE